MADYLSLEEAAAQLNMAVDDLKRMAQKREVRAITDRGNWKFRQQDIDDIKLSRGSAQSNPFALDDDGLQTIDAGEDDIMDSDDQVLIDEGSLSGALDASSTDATIIGMRGGPSAGDSNVHLVVNENLASPSGLGLSEDSDKLDSGKLEPAAPLAASDSDSGALDFDIVASPNSSDSMKFNSAIHDDDVGTVEFNASMFQEFDAAKASDSGSGKSVGSHTEAELPVMPSDKPEKKGKADAGEQQFAQTVELNVRDSLNDETTNLRKGDDEFNFDDDVGLPFSVEGGSDKDLALASLNLDEEDDDDQLNSLAGKGPAPRDNSGLSLSGSSDRISLEDVAEEDGDDIFGDHGSDEVTARGPESGINLASPVDSGLSLEKIKDSDDSEFELSLDSEADADVFNTDDFEVPGFKDSEDSGAKLAAATKGKDEEEDSDVGSDSDFELEIDEDIEAEEESASEVVAVDEDEDGDEAESDDEEYEEDYEDAEGAVALARSGGAGVMVAEAPWPGWVIPVLAINGLILLPITGIMMYEMMRSAWSYTTPYSISATFINQFAEIAKSVGIGG